MGMGADTGRFWLTTGGLTRYSALAEVRRMKIGATIDKQKIKTNENTILTHKNKIKALNIKSKHKNNSKFLVLLLFIYIYIYNIYIYTYIFIYIYITIFNFMYSFSIWFFSF